MVEYLKTYRLDGFRLLIFKDKNYLSGKVYGYLIEDIRGNEVDLVTGYYDLNNQLGLTNQIIEMMKQDFYIKNYSDYFNTNTEHLEWLEGLKKLVDESVGYRWRI